LLRPRSFLRTGLPTPVIVSSQLATKPSIGHPAQRLSRQRFSALAHRDILRCRSNSVAMGAKRTLRSSHPAAGLWVHGLMEKTTRIGSSWTIRARAPESGPTRLPCVKLLRPMRPLIGAIIWV